jgi:hypothetical protein
VSAVLTERPAVTIRWIRRVLGDFLECQVQEMPKQLGIRAFCGGVLSPLLFCRSGQRFDLPQEERMNENRPSVDLKRR